MHFDDLESWGDYWLQGLPIVSRDLLGIIIMYSWGPGRRGRQGRRDAGDAKDAGDAGDARDATQGR